jgi:hypothetical protein
MSAGLPPADLAKYLDTGMASLHAWGTVASDPNIMYISRRPQWRNFKPERLYVEQPENWMVHDLKIGRWSHFDLFPTPLPMAAKQLVRQLLDCRLVQIGLELQIAVEYVGDQAEGMAFVGNMIGFDPETSQPAYETMWLNSEAVLLPSDPLRVVLDLGERGIVFQIFRHRLVSADFLYTRPAIAAALEEITASGGEISRPRAPIMVSLRATSEELEGPILYATSENTGAAIFEISPRWTRCSFAGYVPPWWRTVSEEERP